MKFYRLIFILLFLSSCAIHAPEQQVLRLSHQGADPKTFNPWISTDATSSLMASQMFHGLLISDPDTDEVKPHLAESFEIKDGGKLIIVKLRQGLRWTDAKPITAYDVEYTWNTLIRDGVAISSIRDIVTVDGKFPEVKAIDDLTVEFRTTKVFAPFIKTIGIEIAPKHHIEEFLIKEGAKTLEQKQQAFNRYLSINTPPNKIVCSGPFKLLKLKSGERIEFEANPKFFLKDDLGQQLPYVKKLIFVYVKDSSADIFKFLAGESHIINVAPQNASLLKTLEHKYGFTLYDSGPSTGTSFMWFNLSHNVPEPKYSWFNDSNFRKAISYAIDRENIVNNVYQGLGAPLFTAESLKSPFLNEKLAKGHVRDLDYAKKILLQSGFKFKISPKTRKLELRDAENNRVEFTLYTNAGNEERELMSVIIINNLKDIGIKVNFKPLEFNNFVSRITQAKDYDSGILGLTGGNEPNSGANVWKSSGRLHMFDPKQYQKNPLVRDWETDIDKIFEEGVQVIRFQDRKKYYDRFQEIVYQENPYIYIASPKILTAVSNKIDGVKMTKYEGPVPYLYRLRLKQYD